MGFFSDKVFWVEEMEIADHWGIDRFVICTGKLWGFFSEKVFWVEEMEIAEHWELICCFVCTGCTRKLYFFPKKAF